MPTNATYTFYGQLRLARAVWRVFHLRVFQMKTAFFTVGLCLCATTAVMADVPLPQAVSAFFSTQNKKDCEAWVDLFDDNFEVCVMTALAHLGLHCRGITARVAESL